MEQFYIAQASQPTTPTQNTGNINISISPGTVQTIVIALISALMGGIIRDFLTRKRDKDKALREDIKNNEKYKMSQDYEKALFQTEKELVRLNLLQAEIKNDVAGLATRKQVEELPTRQEFANLEGKIDQTMVVLNKMNERLDSWITNK